ncbi:unnamed protein product [Camellia sinensis]
MITKFILRLKNKDSKFMHVSSFKDNQLLSPLVILASWTGRYEAHLWDKNCWNESQNKKGRQGLSWYVPMMMKKLLLKDKQPLYWWFECDDSRVTTFKIVPRGTEGAVSVEGTVAGLLASILLSFVGYLMGEDKGCTAGGRPRVADFVHGSDGLGNISLPPPKSKKIEKKASEFLVDIVSKYPGEVSILVLGPLTNFALAMKRDSSFASKVKRVVILGGSFFALGNVNPAAEANSLGVVAALVAEAELAEKTEQLQEGVVESGVVVTPTKPKKCKAALPLKSDRGKWGQGMWEVTPEMEALKLAPCAMAAQDEKSDVPNNICQQVKKLGQNPCCLCAVMLSDTASIRRALQVLHCVEDGIIVHEQPLFYEEPDELLALEDQIGNVSTGLSEEAILAAVRRHCYLSMKLGPPVEEEPCCICQEDYVDGKELGKLNCGHEFHFNCIKQWLVRRITVPFEKRLQWLFERSSVSGNSYPKSEIICQSVVPVNFSPVPSPSELIPSACHFLLFVSSFFLLFLPESFHFSHVQVQI